jgi:hypothetical protein
VTLSDSTPDTGDAILVTVNAVDNVEVTGVMADGVSLTKQSNDIWTGTITAIEGTHSVNVSAHDAAGNVVWDNSSSYTATTPTVTNSISGFKINDLNGNRRQDAGETGLSGWNIRLIGIGPDTFRVKKETTTDDKGFYRFENLPAGRYIVMETPMIRGYVPTDAPVKVVKLEDGTNSINNNFMNRPIRSLFNIPFVFKGTQE